MIKKINKRLKDLKKCKKECSSINHEEIDSQIILLKTTKSLLLEDLIKRDEREKIKNKLPRVLEAVDNTISRIYYK